MTLSLQGSNQALLYSRQLQATLHMLQSHRLLTHVRLLFLVCVWLMLQVLHASH